MKIIIRSIAGDETTLEVEHSDSIESVKNEIDKLGDKSSDQQELVFGEQTLENERTLASYNIENNSILSLLDRNIQILVISSTGTIVCSNLEPSDTIEKVKEEIQRHQGIQPEDQKLFLSEEELQEERSLASYNLRKNSILDLFVLGIDEDIKIYIKTLTGKTMTFYVRLFYNIGYIKTLIKNQEGIPLDQQKLMLAKIHLRDEKTLAEYKIRNESKLFFLLSFKGC